jgi:hypothetical protein
MRIYHMRGNGKYRTDAPFLPQTGRRLIIEGCGLTPPKDGTIYTSLKTYPI